jgi:hypothetical protein
MSCTGVGDPARCPPANRYEANGVSWFNRDATVPIANRNFDQAIAFLSRPRVLPSYYQYNYKDNVSLLKRYQIQIFEPSKMAYECINACIRCCLLAGIRTHTCCTALDYSLPQ